MVFQGWKTQEWGSPTLGSPNCGKYESSSSSCSTRHEVEGPLAAPSFVASVQTTVPHVRSHRTRNIQRYHPQCNELAIPNRATAKRTRKTSQISKLHATNFAWICIDVQVQVLCDRVVAKLAKLLSRWRTRQYKMALTFAYGQFLTDDCVSDHNERIRSIQIDKKFITQTFRMYNFIISRTVRN